jgi:DHA1 family bicyclomycin/chloramphenicol resistance-like MFS transporter
MGAAMSVTALISIVALWFIVRPSRVPELSA